MLSWLAAGCLACLLVAATEARAQDKAKDLIVGKWAPADEKQKGLTIEFTKDGKVTINVAQGDFKLNLDGTYKFTGDMEFEISIKGPGGEKPKTDKVKIKSITKDEMTTLNPTGKEEKMKRVTK